MRKLLIMAFCLCSTPALADWFEDLKATATDDDLYRVLYHMPKGGDLHHHLSGSTYSEWMFELALQQSERGYQYYTKVRIENCVPYGGNQFGRDPYYLMFRNIMAIDYEQLGDSKKVSTSDSKT